MSHVATVSEGRGLELWYYCPWCDSTEPCCVCAPKHYRLREIVSSPAFRALREDARRDPAVVGILADWLAERGLNVVAEQLRGAR